VGSRTGAGWERPTWSSGRPARYAFPDGRLAIDGRVLACDPPRRLEMTFRSHWSGEPSPTSRVTLDIRPDGDHFVLTVAHADVPDGMAGELEGGWGRILAGLRDLLESGGGEVSPAR
jgi:uncharacterized protein YndB with AHSA1/START domain